MIDFNVLDRVLSILYEYFCAGMQKLTNFSEGVRESLRRLSHITWMAEELHQVADYLMPNNSVSRTASSSDKCSINN